MRTSKHCGVGQQMQRSRARLSFPGSSRSSLGSSGTSSGASLGLRSEQGDELELYLSLVAGNCGRRKEERRGSAKVDWSKLLDGQNEASEEEDSVETEGDGDVLQFLKPKSQPKESSQQDAGKSKDTSDTFELSDKSSDKVAARYLKTRPPHTDITDTDSISVTDDSISSPRKSGVIHTTAIAGTSRGAAELPAQPLGDEKKSRSMDHGKLSTSSATRPQRVSQESSTTSTEEDTSEFSVQELGLSSQFRNILTLEELEAINSSNPDQNTTTGIVAEESGEASCHSEERSRLHNIVSLADLDSLPAESRTALPGREVANPEVTPQYGHYTDTQQEDHHSTTYYTESGTSSSEVQRVREKAGMSEDTHTLLSYEEDFEDETLKSATISHSRGRNSGENTGTNSPSELGPEYSSLWDQTNSETTAGKSESTEAAVGGGDQISAEGPTHKAEDTVSEETFKPNLKG